MEFKEAVGKDSEGFELYEVESIRDKKIENGKTLYFIKWAGWPEETNTWEPIENLNDVLDLVEIYNRRNRDKNQKNQNFEVFFITCILC